MLGRSGGIGLRASVVCLACVAGSFAPGGAARPAGSVWVRQSGFEQLARGTAGDAGANLYVSAKGRIQTIQRRDLNLDGELDLVFTQDHNNDYAPDAMIYWGGPEGHRSLLPELPQLRSPYTLARHAEQARRHITWLPALGGGRCKIADFNGDGYPDIVFGNHQHNYRQDTPAYVYWGSAQGFRESDRSVLPAYIASGVAVGDLDEDGLPDVVLANQGTERGMEDRFGKGVSINHLESYIYWGDVRGFPRVQIPDTARRTSVPTVFAADVAIGDFNHDGHRDLAFANSSAQERSVYVYWGDGTGRFEAARRQVLRFSRTGPDAVGIEGDMQALAAADLDGDGIDDLVAAGKRNAIVFRGSSRGLVVAGARELPADNCFGLEAADLDRDGRVDLVVANAGAGGAQAPASTIYWGGAGGFDRERRTDLPTRGAMTVAAADLDGDGVTDLLFGNKNDDGDVPSQIFWGSRKGFAPYRRSDLQGFGVVGSGVADLDRDGHPDIVLVNHLSGHGVIPSAIYWGNPEHHYSSASMSLLEPGGEMMYSVADLDDDGFPDLVMNHSGQPYVWWGSASGYRAADRTPIPFRAAPPAGREERCYSFNVADLDRDGWLDVVCVVTGDVNIGTASIAQEDRRFAKAVIVHGNDRRFQGARRGAELRLSGYMGAQSLAIADLDKNGYLDLIFPMSDIGHSEIWWGGAGGYDASRVTRVEANGSPCAVVADLDRDGWLDVVFTSSFGPRGDPAPRAGGAGLRGLTVDSKTVIYYGGPDGLKAGGELESFTALDAAVADFNRDGHLDIALTNYKSDTTRELPAIVYWGDGKRNFSEKRRTFLDAASSSAVEALDLDRDGWLDVIVSNHQKNFSHLSGTNIYWGGARGFQLSRRTTLPTIGVHLDTMVDAGNVYDRTYVWSYVSAPLESPAGVSFARLHWKAETRFGTEVKFQVRTAATRDGLAQAAWSGPEGADSSYTKAGASLPGVGARDRWLQYRAVLGSPDGGNSPILTEVALECTQP